MGTLLARKYRVLAKLGEGGMGAVYHSENIVTGKQVAIKCLRPQLGDKAGAFDRLLREARAGSRLNHPNLVDVYDAVQDDGSLFLVMALLEGETLRSYLDRSPCPDAHEFLGYMVAALEGIAAAHEAGVLHRDLKPENVFLAKTAGSAAPVPKVLDFGIAKLLAPYGPTLTQSGAVLGTPLYMPVEQLRGDKDIDTRADIYAAGVILYEGLVGALPYVGDTLAELAIKMATTDAPRVASLRPDLPEELTYTVDRALSRERELRPADMRALVHVLRRSACLSPHVSHAAETALHRQEGQAGQNQQTRTLVPSALPIQGPVKRWPRRLAVWLWIASAIAGAAGLSAIAALWWQASLIDARRPGSMADDHTLRALASGDPPVNKNRSLQAEPPSDSVSGSGPTPGASEGQVAPLLDAGVRFTGTEPRSGWNASQAKEDGRRNASSLRDARRANATSPASDVGPDHAAIDPTREETPPAPTQPDSPAPTPPQTSSKARQPRQPTSKASSHSDRPSVTVLKPSRTTSPPSSTRPAPSPRPADQQSAIDLLGF